MTKQIFLIIILVFSSVLINAQKSEMLTIEAPEKVLNDKSFSIIIQLNSEKFSSYHSLQMSFPQGFAFEVNEKGNAIIQQEHGNIKLLWVSESLAQGKKTSIKVKPSKTLNGTYRIPVELQFMENMKKMVKKLPSIEILILEKSNDSTLYETKKHVFEIGQATSKITNALSVQNNLEYRVQLFMSAEALKIEWIARQYGLKESDVVEEISDGKYLYTTGSFKNEADAKKWLNSKEKIKSQGFLVKFVNGKITN